MQSIKRNFTVGAALSALTLAFAIAPFLAVAARAQEPGKQPPAPQQPQPQMPDQTQPKSSSTFTGTIVKDGDGYSLHASTGSTYKLDDSSKAQQFEGKSVKVTGQLDEQAKMIHVENIEGSEG